MENFKYNLDVIGNEIRFKILEQNPLLISKFDFVLKGLNGWYFFTSMIPTISLSDKEIFLRGRNDSKDYEEVVLKCTQKEINDIKLNLEYFSEYVKKLEVYFNKKLDIKIYNDRNSLINLLEDRTVKQVNHYIKTINPNEYIYVEIVCHELINTKYHKFKIKDIKEINDRVILLHE